MTQKYSIDDVAKHILSTDWSFPHSDDDKANFSALYNELARHFPDLSITEFADAFTHAVVIMRDADQRPT